MTADGKDCKKRWKPKSGSYKKKFQEFLENPEKFKQKARGIRLR